MKVLIDCEFSGVVRDAFRSRGHEAWSCDILACESDPQYHLQMEYTNLPCSGLIEYIDDSHGRGVYKPSVVKEQKSIFYTFSEKEKYNITCGFCGYNTWTGYYDPDIKKIERCQCGALNMWKQ